MSSNIFTIIADLEKRIRKVTCNKRNKVGKCISGKIYVSGDLCGERLVILFHEELRLIKKTLSEIEEQYLFLSIFF